MVTFFSAPLAKVCEYQAQLEEILSHSPAGHPDHGLLTTAVADIRSACALFCGMKLGEHRNPGFCSSKISGVYYPILDRQ